MPVSDPMLDPGYADLISELRDARTPTPATLEARMDELLARPVEAPRRRRLPRLRMRPVLGIAGGCAVLALGVFAASQMSSGTETEVAASSSAAAAAETIAAPAASTAAAATDSAIDTAQSRAAAGSGSAETETLSGELTGVPTASDDARLQHQTAHLTVALASSDAVSDATTQVTSAIATYGGHIVTVQFATPEGGEARAEIVAKVPIERMQDATNRFSALGRLAGAQVDISDLQERADSLEQRVASARLQIAKFDAQLAGDDLTKLQKATLVERRARARQRLADLNASVAQTRQDAAQADLTVTLVTDDQVVVPTKSDSGFGARAGDAVGLLADVAVYAIYALVVVAPLALLALLWLAGRTVLRRRRNRRLLETA